MSSSYRLIIPTRDSARWIGQVHNAYRRISTSGFRDFTRIAASDPTMWRDVFLNNKDAVLEMLDRFNADLASLRALIERSDGQGLFDLFTRTRAIRRGIIEQGQDTAAPDFGRGTTGKL